MKRYMSILLSLIFLFSLAACASEPISDIPSPSPSPETSASPEPIAPQNTENPVVSPEPEPEPLYRQLEVDYTLSDKLPPELVEHIKERRKSVFVEVTDEGKALFESWKGEGPDAENDERVADMVKELKKNGGPKERPESITRDEAIEEINFIFDYMKCGYSGYNYFGGDNVFLPVRDGILAKLDELVDADGNIDTLTYRAYLLIDSLRTVINDNHFFLGNNFSWIDHTLYYAFSEELTFQKDNGSYKTSIDGKEFTLVSIDGADPSPYVKATLLEDGSFAYVLGKTFANKDIGNAFWTGNPPVFETIWNEDPINVLLKSGDEKKNVDVTLDYDLSVYKGKGNVPAYNSYEKDGVMVLENTLMEASADMAKMNSTEEQDKFKNQKTVIIDVIGNGGGNVQYAAKWLEYFLGITNISQSLVSSVLQTRTALAASGQGSYNDKSWSDTFYGSPKLNKNQTITFLLKGANSSSGELWENYLLQTDNVITVGIHSSGSMQFPEGAGLVMPYSGIWFRCDFGLVLMNQDFSEFENIGYEPDLWIDPSQTLERVSKFIELYGLNE